MVTTFAYGFVPEQAGQGPFFLQPVNANEAIVSVPEFTHPYYHDKGRVQINIAGRWINVWAKNIKTPPPEEDTTEVPPDPVADSLVFDKGEYETFFFDFEVFTLIPQISFKISERISAEIKIPFYFYSGGELDSFIEGFHDLFGIDQNKRTVWDQNDISLLFVRKDGTHEWKDESVKGAYYGDLVTGVSIRVRDSRPAIGFRSLVRIPTSNQEDVFEQPGGYDVTLQTVVSWRLGNFFGYHGAGITFFDYDKEVLMDYYDRRGSFMNTIEYALTPGFSLLCHSVVATPLADYSAFDEPVIEIAVGFKGKALGGTFEFGIMENIINYDNSPDVGFHIGYTVSLF